ncbi:MAG: N-acetylmuramoyl-L-alanine amidase [Cereibacter sphaeroides]|uniref:N-acetylmuramoyl-L-alanine amidase n=1 Tax=Cereibacter sphaeroides TaxID=1063 RepID=A0A2W5TTD0_CERSP|nr:MAG: N-acetylmuramoyl-L-alanine amidase [Cereibacter sphaeroides]
MSGLTGIVMHWTAGGPRASALDRQHYHFMVQQDCQIIAGIHAPEANIAPKQGAYAAHTLNANTGRIGVALCGMMGAGEAPFTAGQAPINEDQVYAFCKMIAGLAKKYGIKVDRQHVLSHAEVQPTLGIKQRGKWDITWLPGMAHPDNPVKVGDQLRAKILL